MTISGGPIDFGHKRYQAITGLATNEMTADRNTSTAAGDVSLAN
jgi:hypothetical protein